MHTLKYLHAEGPPPPASLHTHLILCSCVQYLILCSCVQYLYAEFTSRGASTLITRYFHPGMARQLSQRCALACLEGCSLAQLAGSPAAARVLLQPAGGGGESGGSASWDGGGGAGRGGGGGADLAGLTGHQLLDRLGRLVGQELVAGREGGSGGGGVGGGAAAGGGANGSGGGSSGGGGGALPPQQLAELLVRTFTEAYLYWFPSGGGGREPGSSGDGGWAAGAASGGGGGREGSSVGDASVAAVAVHLVSILHRHEALHTPFLGLLRRQAQEAGPAGRLGGAQAEAWALLAAAAGAALLPGRDGMQLEEEEEEHGIPALFTWQQQQQPEEARGVGGGARPGGYWVAGPAWLTGLWRELPLTSVGAISWAGRLSAAHLRIAQHFPPYLHLASSPAVAGAAAAAAPPPVLQQPALLPPGVAALPADLLGRLSFTLCPAAVQLLQWLHARLLLASGGLGWPPGAAARGTPPPAKRIRLEGSGDGAALITADSSVGAALLKGTARALQDSGNAQPVHLAGVCAVGVPGRTSPLLVHSGLVQRPFIYNKVAFSP